MLFFVGVFWRRQRARLSLFFIIFFVMTSLKAEPTDIVLWHSLAGALGEEVNRLAIGFNHSQSDYVIKPIYKGDYIESLTSFSAAFRAHQAPALVQVFEVGTGVLLASPEAIKPVDDLMVEQCFSLPKSDFFPAVLAYYSRNGRLMAMPFNISIPVLFYNKAVLAKAGYAPNTFPRTWDEFEALAVRLKRQGFSCTYTSAYPSWILMESYSALHGLAMMDKDSRVAVYNNAFMVRHLARLLRWKRLHYFDYGGRTDDATMLFTSGRCPVLSQSSGGYNSLSQLALFSVGIAPMPLDEGVSHQRSDNVVGGAALWAVAQQSPKVYQGIAQFFMYLSTPRVQKEWHQRTGYLPLGVTGGYERILRDEKTPLLLLAESEWGSEKQGVSVGPGAQHEIRSINDKALEWIFSGMKTPQEALDLAVARANEAEHRFVKNTM